MQKERKDRKEKNVKTLEELVIYKDDSKMWARPIDSFCSLVDKEKYKDVKQKYRFEKIDD